jgi:hypothetical protein
MKNDEVKTIPVFPNVFPWNELLLDEKIFAKTRDWNWKYRGPILLYTSRSRIDKITAELHNLDPKKYVLGAIVGVGNLIDVRELKLMEQVNLFRQFNRTTKKEALDFYRYNYSERANYALPMDFGFFFENLKHFETPIIFKYPSGPVRYYNLPITEFIEKELKKLGINI